MTSFDLNAQLQSIDLIADLNDLEAKRIELLGKNGLLTQELKALSKLSIEEKKDQGQRLNIIKKQVSDQLQTQKDKLEKQDLEHRLVSEKIDLTRPVQPSTNGKIHPLTQTIQEVIAIFGQMGFKLETGPEIERDDYNFDYLNIPPEHPARQDQDTFYMPDTDQSEKMVLRTQTSPVQIRTMLHQEPPIQIIVPGRTFRSDSDQTHTPMFHQVEGLYIDKEIHMGHLKGCLEAFLTSFFGVKNLPIRFRPSYFPFTEPSAEVDIGCHREGETFTIGEGQGWLEILGCGMVHPQVLKNCGIDPKQYQGFAFGMGLERITMLKYGISDLRTFFEGDQEWINHYGFKSYETPGILNRLQGGIGR
jgi:phenylalanyl-tRNA synthetase alpha chain